MISTDAILDMLAHGQIEPRPTPYPWKGFGNPALSENIMWALDRNRIDAILDVCRRDAWADAVRMQDAMHRDAGCIVRPFPAPFPEILDRAPFRWDVKNLMHQVESLQRRVYELERDLKRTMQDASSAVNMVATERDEARQDVKEWQRRYERLKREKGLI